MATALTSVLCSFGLLLCGLPGNAQVAYTRVERPTSLFGTEPVETPTPSVKVLHGVVQDQRGVLPGATVWLQGSRTIVVTNSEGEFELRVPANAKSIRLTCGYGGLQEETVTLAPAEALGSVYLLRPKVLSTATPVVETH